MATAFLVLVLWTGSRFCVKTCVAVAQSFVVAMKIALCLLLLCSYCIEKTWCVSQPQAASKAITPACGKLNMYYAVKARCVCVYCDGWPGCGVVYCACCRL